MVAGAGNTEHAHAVPRGASQTANTGPGSRRVTRWLLALTLGALLAVTGCSAPSAPEVTFFADGESVRAKPLVHCDTFVRECARESTQPASLRARPGKPIQVSLPTEVTDTPWAVNVQYLGPDGQPRPVKQDFFTPGTQHAYTASPSAPSEQMLVVEIQQLGAAYAADQAGNPILDPAGNPQLVVRSVWSLQVTAE